MNMKISRLIAGLLAWFGLSVIYTEIINNFNLLGFKLKFYYVAIPVLVIFLFSELLINIYQSRANFLPDQINKRQPILTAYNLILGLIGLIFLVSIPFLWWGVIKKLAMVASQGKKPF